MDAFLVGEAKFEGPKWIFVVQSGMHVVTNQYQKPKATQLCPPILFSISNFTYTLTNKQICNMGTAC